MTTTKKTTDLQTIVRAGVRPERAAPDMRVYHQVQGGLTTYKKKRIASVSAPMVRGSYARTIRIHELLHANYSPVTQPKQFHPICNNAIEDIRVHSVYWPARLPQRANRDCLATGLRDARNLPAMADMTTADVWNISLLIAARSLAIVEQLGSQRQLTRVSKRLSASFPQNIVEALFDIVRLAKGKRTITKARKAFTALMRSDDDKDGDKAHGSTGAATGNPMRIVKLPLVEPCAATAKRTSLSRSGARLNRGRLASAIATGSTAGLFIRQRYLPGGTYLFDASGSMRISEDRLNDLCRSVPAATVAYYSGDGGPRSDGSYGTLVIYSQGGQRAREIAHHYGGNEVDLYAIQWLLKQPGPRTLVSDGGFAGGPEGQDIAAAKLVATAVANGDIVWQQTV